MSAYIDRYSQLDGYLRSYYFFKDILTDMKYNPIELTVEDSEHWLGIIEGDIKAFEHELATLAPPNQTKEDI